MLNRITLRQMQYFVSTARYQSIARASAQIHISSASISAAIRHIETELKLQLFTRQHAKALSLTTVGEKIYQEFVLILAQLDAVYHRAATGWIADAPRLIVGCHAGAAVELFQRVIHPFQQLYPNIAFELLDWPHAELLNGLLNQSIDILISSEFGLNRDVIEFEALATFSPYVLMSQQHPLAQHKALSLVQLLQFPLLLQQDSVLENYIAQLFARYHLSPHSAQSYQSQALLCSVLANSMAYSIFNYSSNAQMHFCGLKKIPLLETEPALKLGVASIATRQNSQHCSEFIHFCRDAMRDHMPSDLNLSPYKVQRRQDSKNLQKFQQNLSAVLQS